MRVAVIGMGRVGLVTAACLAHVGHDVIGVDDDAERVAGMERGELPLLEPALEPLVREGRRAARLAFSSDLKATIRDRAVAFICVGIGHQPNGAADLSAVERVTRRIASAGSRDLLVVEKNTVPANTGAWIERTLAMYATSGARDIEVASNPEFLRQGSAVCDTLHPDRIVVGVGSPRAAGRLRELYAPILEGHFACPFHPACAPAGAVPFVVTSIQSAEVIKVASSAFLAAKISFVNMVADLSERVGADIVQVAEGMGLDGRIGGAFLQAGLGFGGPCLPRDVQAFVRLAEEMGVDFGFLREAVKVNARRIEAAAEKLRKALLTLQGKRIGLLGMAFKPHTDEVRHAPALALAAHLLQDGADVVAYDPRAGAAARNVLPRLVVADDPYAVAEGADALVLATEWPDFLSLDWARLRRAMRRPVLLDGRNALDREKLVAEGFEYLGMGR